MKYFKNSDHALKLALLVKNLEIRHFITVLHVKKDLDLNQKDIQEIIA